MSIRDWPADERPREKLLAHGAQQLSDAELLAIFLRTGCRGKNAVSLARELLVVHGSLRSLLQASQEAFCASCGLGPAKYAQLQAVLEMARRHFWQTLEKGDSLQDPAATEAYLLTQLRDLPHEVFGCLYLDNRHRVIRFETLFRGTIDGASVYPREVVSQALARRAAAVIFAHNHPSGVAEPSLADRQITQRLRDALQLVDIRVLDHIIVGEGQCYSFARHGLL